MKKKILILSPINQWGGVNIDVGFIAQFYKTEGHQVQVLSLGEYYDDSSVLKFIKREEFDSINRLLYKKYWLITSILKVLNFFKPMDKPLHHRVNNKITKAVLPLKFLKIKILKKNINNSDTVLICHHLTGSFSREIIEISKSLNKSILFRVTQQIDEQRMLTPSNIKWLNKVNSYILHSKKNLIHLKEKITKSNYYLVDQCVLNETHFLQKSAITSVRKFYMLSRFEKTKNISQAIKAFKTIDNNEISLSIFGDGSQKDDLLQMTLDDGRISIFNHVDFDEIVKTHTEHDCLIISSKIEAGPYTGLEAMAAGNLIISTRVGAMEERLGKDYPYFYEGSENDLSIKITEVIKTDNLSLIKCSNKLKQNYQQNYSYNKIAEQYVQLLNDLNLI